MSGKTRDVLKILVTNFLKSFRPRKIFGDFKGKDYHGTEYYEIPADPARGKRRDERWFKPTDPDKFNQSIPAEWEAWLRGRRKVPPTTEEVTQNYQMAMMKKENAARIEEKYRTTKDADQLEKMQSGMKSFPDYKEYEVIPGKKRGEN